MNGWVSGLRLWLGLGRLQGRLDRLQGLHDAQAAEDERIARLDALLARLDVDPPPDDAELDLLERELRDIDPEVWHQVQKARRDAGLP